MQRLRVSFKLFLNIFPGIPRQKQDYLLDIPPGVSFDNLPDFPQ